MLASRPVCVAFVLVSAVLVAGPVLAQGSYPQSQGWSRVVPSVVWCGDPTSTVTIEFHVVGRTDVDGVQVTNQFEHSRIKLYDDGTHGDAIAGDAVFTASGVQPYCIPYYLNEGDVAGGWVGFIRVRLKDGTELGNNYGISIGLVDPALKGVFPVTDHGGGLSSTEYAFFIHDTAHEVMDGYPVASVYCGTANFEAYRKLYSVMPDAFDFAVVTAGRQIFRPSDLAENVPYSVLVKRPATGIGMAPRDNTAMFGSSGRLQDVIYLSFGSIQIFDHEVAHAWGASLGSALGLLNSDGWHWSAVSDIGGQLGYYYLTADGRSGHFVDNGDGTWRWAPNTENRQYAPLELYAMGLIPPEQVPPVHVLTSPDLTNLDRITAASVKTVTMAQIVGIEGPRVPSVTSSPKAFNLAYIVTDDQPFTEASYAFFSALARRLTTHEGPSPRSMHAPFYWATGGRATLETRLPTPATDGDHDGLNDEWERRGGLHPHHSPADAPAGDADGDGLTNLQESQLGSHPRGLQTRYFAEGATGGSLSFDARFSLLNPGATAARTFLRFQKGDGSTVNHFVTVPARTRVTVDAQTIAGLATAEFSTVVESDVPVVSDRSMTWGSSGYGGHAETAIVSPATTWYLAEGATHSGFELFYLVQNPGNTTADVEVTFLRPSPASPIVKTYRVQPHSRFNIWVDLQDPGLAATDVSSVIRVTNGVPVIVERAMYLDTSGQTFGAGHNSAGVTAPATHWFLAEGATGPFFDLFVLVANPDSRTASIEARFLLPDGSVITKTYNVAGNSRFNIWVDLEDPRLRDTAVSTVIRSLNDVPILVERAMWWPGPTAATWMEAHNSPGATATGTRWGLADGELGKVGEGPDTYILVANTSAAAGNVRVTLFFDDGTPAAVRTFTVPGNSRFNVDVRSYFPEATFKRFGALVESLEGRQIVVERAMYSNAGGVFWAAGSNALATRLTP